MKEIKINDIKILAHTTWYLQFHVVFAPKYRRKVFYESKRLEIGQILRKLSNFMGFLKEKSSIMIYSKWANMWYQYRNREF